MIIGRLLGIGYILNMLIRIVGDQTIIVKVFKSKAFTGVKKLTIVTPSKWNTIY